MTAPSPAESKWVRRVWLGAYSSLLVAFAFVQSPGWIAPDTKYDLTENPAGLLARALVLWDPSGAGGQLQNQAYGYLFPMGPFFWVAQEAGLSAWVVQRLWWAAILLVGFHGARTLLERLGIGTAASQIIAAFTFALAPRMLMGLGAVSSEIWPMAMAPWVLVPLIRVQHGQERAAAIRSGVAILMVGAVNATATIAVLAPAAIWILTRSTPVRWRLAAWWSASVVLASAWWVGPLLLLGQFSPPFLDWIESAAVTTAAASLPESLRGTTQWIGGISGARGPLWIAGYEVISSRIVVAMGLLIAVTGVIGLALRAPRHWGTFARITLVVGLGLVTAGRVGPSTGVGAPQVADLLDGILAPLRNTHKFEPIVRIALVCGVAHALPRIQAWLRLVRAPAPRLANVVLVLALIAQTAYPALVGVSQRGRYVATPSYWHESSDWLSEHPVSGRTLVVPGSNAATSIWGDPRDEPLQALATTPWMVRDGVPLGSASTTRLLNEVESRLATGYGGAELSNLLHRLGVSRVLLRSDLVAPGIRPLVVRHALETAGAVHSTSFGPFLGGSFDPAVVNDFGMERPLRAIEILEMPTPAHIAPRSLVPLDDFRIMSGGPEGIAHLSPDNAVIFAADAESAEAIGAAPTVLTDTLQRREATFAGVRDNYGPLLTATDDFAAQRRAHDWLPSWLPEDATDVQTQRVWPTDVIAEASSSLALPGLGQPRELGSDAESAFDASGDTAWQSAGFDPVGQWVEARWNDSLEVPEVLQVTVDPQQGADIAAVTIATDQGELRTPVTPPGLTERSSEDRYTFNVAVPAGPTTRLRFMVADVRNSRPTVRVWDVGAGAVPRAESWVQLPEGAGGVAQVINMDATRDRRPSCTVMSSGVLVCNPRTARAGEESTDLRRIFTGTSAASYRGSGTVYPRESKSVESLLARLDGVAARATSTWLPGASVSAQLLVDGDDRTYWASDPTDSEPSVTLSWPGNRVVTGLRISTDSDVPGRRPVEVAVSFDGHDAVYSRQVNEDGVVSLPARVASEVTIAITGTTSQTTGVLGGRAQMPIVMGDVSLIGQPWPQGSLNLDSPIVVPCGFGPQVQVAGRTYPTTVSGTRGELIAGDALEFDLCADVDVLAGENRVQLLSSAEFGPRSLTLTKVGGPDLDPRPSRVMRVAVTEWTETSRVVRIPQEVEAPSVLVVRENANPGWNATLSGEPLAPITVDGWAQGWVVPAGAVGEVEIDFVPQRAFIVTLLIGLVAAFLLVTAALRATRRSTDWWAVPVAPGRALSLPASLVLLVLAGGAIAGLVGAVLSLWSVIVVGITATRRLSWGLIGIAVALVAWSAFAPWPASAATNRDAVSQALAWALISGALAIGAAGDRARALRSSGEHCPGSDAPTGAN